MKSQYTFKSMIRSQRDYFGIHHFVLLIFLFISACTRSIPSPTEAIRFPNTPTANPTNNQENKQTTTPEMKEDSTGEMGNLPHILDVGHFDTELLIFTIQFPAPIAPEEYLVKISEEIYECVLQDEMDDRLYCFGPFISTETALVTLERKSAPVESIEIELDLSAIQLHQNE